jgi:hypothetical protein
MVPIDTSNCIYTIITNIFLIGAVISAIAVILSALRGERYIHGDKVVKNGSKSDIVSHELEIVEKSS